MANESHFQFDDNDDDDKDGDETNKHSSLATKTSTHQTYRLWETSINAPGSIF